MITAAFWTIFGVILYSYLGYTLILLLLSLFKPRKKTDIPKYEDLPAISLVIAAYNEKPFIDQKVHNTRNLNYPKEKLHTIWVTDGSTDESEIFLKNYPEIEILHRSERLGKMAAITRAMQTVKTPITVFCDVNTNLHPDSILWLIASFADNKIGCVAGEKTIADSKSDNAAGAGEGFYWKYESLIKNLEAHVGSTVGAAGELYAIRTNLFEPPGNDAVIDDFLVSFEIAKKGYKISYQAKAIATEKPSDNINEENKRKIRIAAGSFKVLFGKPEFLNFFKYGFLSFQYFSHKVIRWLLIPLLIPFLLILNILIVCFSPDLLLYKIILISQGLFYFLVLMGFLFQKEHIKPKIIFLPYYIINMNLNMYKGFIRYINGSQSAAWEKVKRRN